MDAESLMRRAIELSQKSLEHHHLGPFGAVVSMKGAIVGEGVNEVTLRNDPTAHAEVVAIRNACRELGRYSLEDCALYASCEPCPMCLATALWARVDHIVFAADRYDAAKAGFDDAQFYELILDPELGRARGMRRMLEEEARSVLKSWAQKPDRILY